MRLINCLAIAHTVAIIVVGAVSQTEHRAQLNENVHISDSIDVTVTKAISRWESENKIGVTAGASSLIEEGFRKDVHHINEALSSQKQQALLLGALVENYLFDVRDEKLQKLSKTKARLVGGSVETSGFLPQSLEQQLRKIVDRIEEPDLQLVPLLQFLEAKLSEWQDQLHKKFSEWPDDALARLRIMSLPDGAGIELDGKGEGFTCRKMVVTAGNHTVKIRFPAGTGCEKTLRVSAGAPVTASCSPTATCAHWSTDEQ